MDPRMMTNSLKVAAQVSHAPSHVDILPLNVHFFMPEQPVNYELRLSFQFIVKIAPCNKCNKPPSLMPCSK